MNILTYGNDKRVSVCRYRIEERLEMTAELIGHNVFVQFLPDAALVLLINLNNTVNISVDIVLKHIFDLHGNAFRWPKNGY